MVFFTCNACGASLKKNQVEKHYQNECPTCEVLSCMDCGQDFYGDAYANHTKCISEAEKYQGALYKESGKGGPGKGERKQQEWLEQVKQSVSGANVSSKVAGLLERIADYPNIPRKRAKFENFVRNSFNVRDQKTLTQLWDAFSGAQKKNQPNQMTTEKAVADKEASAVQAKELVIDNDGTEPVPKKKKKKHKEKEEAQDPNDADDIVIANGVENGDVDHEVPKRKKQKRKTEPTANDVLDATSVAVTIEMEDDDPPATKKVKKKKQKAEETVDHTDKLVDIEGVDHGEEALVMKKAKKKKHKEKESSSGDDSRDVLGKKRKHNAKLDCGADEEVIQAKRQKGCKALEDDHELSDETSQAVVKKHKKKKHKH